MGRFYETEKSRFVDDFIYKPNYNLMNAVLEKEQTGFNKVNTDNADLLNQLNVKYIEESEKERLGVANEKAKYAGLVDNITNQIRDTSKDWRSVRPQIDNLKKDLAQNFATGYFSKVQKSRDTYDKQKEHLKTIKDVGTREAAEKYYFNKWDKENPNGSKDNMFSYQDTFDKRDLQNEFNEEVLKFMATEDIEKASSNPSGGYIITRKDGTKIRSEKSLNDLFDTWVEGKNINPYLQDQQNMGQGNFFGEDGKRLSSKDEQSSLNQGMKAAGILGKVYKSTADEKREADSLYMQRERAAEERAKVAAAKKAKDEEDKQALGGNYDQSAWKNTKNGKDQYDLAIRKLNDLIPTSISAGMTQKEKTAYIDHLRQNGTPQQKHDIMTTTVFFNPNFVSGEADLEKVLGPGSAKVIKRDINSPRVASLFDTEPVVVEFGTQREGVIPGKEGTIYNDADNTSKDGKLRGKYSSVAQEKRYGDKGTGTKLKDFVGQNVGTEANPFIVDSYEKVPATVSSMFYTDDKEQPVIGAVSTIKFKNKEGKEMSVKAHIPKKVVEYTIHDTKQVAGYDQD